MNDSLDFLEARLIAGYRQQADLYESALQFVDKRADAESDAVNKSDEAQDLHDLIQNVAQLDANLAEDKAAWRQSGRSPNAGLRAILDRLASQISILAGHIDRQVAEVVARKQRLVPEIDELVRQRWMLNAYGQTERSARTGA